MKIVIMSRLIFIALILSCQQWKTEGHGRIMEPPGRNAMWRFGYPVPVNYNDNELYCGGYSVQFEQNQGKCGACGDNYAFSEPRDHETGGLYASEIPARYYSPGQTIDITIDLTANHKGTMELYICPTNGVIRETEECFRKYPLNLSGQKTHIFHIPDESKKIDTFHYQVDLPHDLVCSQCVIRWVYRTGNTWGLCKNGTGEMGCGNQETFINCADVAVISNTATFIPPPNYDRFAIWVTDPATKQAERYVNRNQICLATEEYKLRFPDANAWCMQNCLKYPPTCPPHLCTCISECHATGDLALRNGTDVYCHIECLRYPPKCPVDCQCY